MSVTRLLLLRFVALGLLAADLLKDVLGVGCHGAVGIELEVFLVGLFAAGRCDDLAGFGIDSGLADERLTLQVVGYRLVGISSDSFVGCRNDGIRVAAKFGEHDGLVGVKHAGLGGLRLGGSIVGRG